MLDVLVGHILEKCPKNGQWPPVIFGSAGVCVCMLYVHVVKCYQMKCILHAVLIIN